MSRSTLLLALIAWAGFIFSLFNRPINAELSGHGTTTLPEVGVVSIGALACGLLAVVAASSALKDDITCGSAWAWAAFAAAPFFGLLYLLNPYSIGPFF